MSRVPSKRIDETERLRRRCASGLGRGLFGLSPFQGRLGLARSGDLSIPLAETLHHVRDWIYPAPLLIRVALCALTAPDVIPIRDVRCSTGEAWSLSRGGACWPSECRHEVELRF